MSWSDAGPVEVALIGFGGTVVTAAAAIVAARLADRHDERPEWLARLMVELDELRRRVGMLERDRFRRRRPRPPARRAPP